MSKIVKDTLILFMITIFTGLFLGGIFNITAPARKKQDDLAKQEAYKSVMPKTDTVENVKFDTNKANEFVKKTVLDNEKKNKISTIKEFNAVIDEAVLVKDKDGKEIGHIITVTDNEAYDGSLTVVVGIDNNGVSGISFLSLTETPGLGMKADDSSFKNQYKKKVDYFEYTKTNDAGDNKVDAISSATITTNATTHAVNAALAFKSYLGKENHE